MQKRVSVRLEEESQNLLKAYSSVYGLTMSELLEFVWNQYISKQQINCTKAAGLIHATGFKPLPNAGKPCFGHPCLHCTKQIQCQAGIYEGVLHFDDSYREFLTDSAAVMIGDLQEAYNQERQY